MLSSPSDDVKNRISYITDVEGDAAYFDRYIEASQLMKFESATPNYDATQPLEFFPYTKHVVFSNSSDIDNGARIFDQTMLVCGGDVWDKGGGDLYVTRQLLSMQNRYGEDRVHFIIGNRDVNKMRILQEIGIKSDDMPHHHGVYWLKGTGLTGDPELIDLNEKKSGKQLRRSSQALVSPSAPARLTWMLQQTLGCPDAFELRRGELEREKAVCGRAKIENAIDDFYDSKVDCTVTDEEVVQSYRDSCHPTTGVMGEYLRKGKIAMRIGGVLFIHGSIPVSPEILMEYKAYSSRFDDASSDEKATFWNNFFHHAMPWLSNSTTPERPESVEWSNIDVNVSSASFGSDTSGSYHWPKRSMYLQDRNASTNMSNIPHPKKNPPSKLSLCDKILCFLKLQENQNKKLLGNQESRSKQEPMQDRSKDSCNSSNAGDNVMKIERMRYSFQTAHSKVDEEKSKERERDSKLDDNWTSSTHRSEDEGSGTAGELRRENKTRVSFNIELKETKNLKEALLERGKYGADEKAKKIDATVTNIDDWICRLNAFSDRHYEKWAYYVTHNPDGKYCWSRFGGYSYFGALIQYGMGWLPNKDVNQSVVYSTWITDGMPQMVCGNTELDRLHAKFLAEFFSVSGLDLIVSGHQPIGDSPLTIQVNSKYEEKPKFIVIGDTSFSGDTIWVGGSKNMGRGKVKSGRGEVAVSEILIDMSAKNDVVGVTYHGRLSDGLEYKSCNIRTHHPDSSLVGKLLNRRQLSIKGENDNNQTEWIVKAKLSDGSFLVSSGKGFQVFNAIATKRL